MGAKVLRRTDFYGKGSRVATTSPCKTPHGRVPTWKSTPKTGPSYESHFQGVKGIRDKTRQILSENPVIALFWLVRRLSED